MTPRTIRNMYNDSLRKRKSSSFLRTYISWLAYIIKEIPVMRKLALAENISLIENDER